MKKKLVRANQTPYMTKALRKAIMRWSEIEAKHFKLKTNNTLEAYEKQKNYWSRLYKVERTNFFEKLNLSFVVDNKNFNEKGSEVSNEIFLLENDKTLRDEFQVHPSILLIKSKINPSNSFSFTEIETDDVDKEISFLNSKKFGTQNDVPANACKFHWPSFAKTFQRNFKNS